jgi:hypothetical protein
MRALSLGLRFLLELAALVALVGWGLGLHASLPLRVVAGIGAALGFAAVWGVFIAPKARRRLRDPAKVVLELVLFGAAALSLGWPLGVFFAAVVVASEAFTFVFDQRAF